MSVKNTVFYLDIKTLENKPTSELKEFAKSEDLEVKDVVKIILAEAQRIGEEDKVKVTFKTVDNDDDSFRVVVESANVKYKGTIIYPYEKIKSDDFEFVLDAVCGTVTLVNKKDECKKISLTIDGAALDIFAMKYKDAKDFLKELSDRKGKKGYIEYPDSICFKHFGIKLNAQKAENGDILVDSNVASVDVYNKEEFEKQFYFEPEKEEKYDVNIPLPDEYNYEKKDSKKKKSIVIDNVEDEKVEKAEEEEIKIDIPEIDIASEEEKLKEEERKRDEEARKRQEKLEKEQEELERIRKKQDEELEKVKEKLKRELEEEINQNIKKYDEENKKREANVEDLIEEVEDNLPEIEEKAKEVTEEVEEKLPEIKGPIIVNPIIREEKAEIETNILEDEEDDGIEEIANIPHKDGFAELQKKFKILTDEIDEEDEEETTPQVEDEEEIEEAQESQKPQEIKQPEEDFDIKDLDEVLGRTKKEEPEEEKSEIELLQKMFEENRRQQELLESRINAKLEELKAQMKREEPKVEEVVNIEPVKEEIKNEEPKEKKTTKKAETKKVEEKKEDNNTEPVRSYTLESYKGLVDNSTNTLIVYFGQSKREIRKILGKPKEIKDYEEMELYDDFYVYYDEDNKCVGIGLYNDKKYENTLTLTMFDRNLLEMKYRHIVKLIKRNDPNSIEDDDGIISLKYGISVDPKETKDFQDDICDVIHIFQKGYYDEVYENF